MDTRRFDQDDEFFDLLYESKREAFRAGFVAASLPEAPGRAFFQFSELGHALATENQS